MDITPKEYNMLRLYVYKHATIHGFKAQDCDDILHDALFYNTTRRVHTTRIYARTIFPLVVCIHTYYTCNTSTSS